MDKTLDVMKHHLHIVEKYIDELQQAEGKKAIMNAINSCSKSIHEQYGDLEEIADDFCARVKDDKELNAISKRIGDILSGETTKHYGKMGPFMADRDFMEVFSNFDIVVGNNPLFGVNEFGADVAADVSKAIAGSMDGIATKMIADTTDIEDDVLAGISGVMESFLDISKKYVAKMNDANTARKAVTATDAFVAAIKKQIPEMKKYSDQLKLVMAKDEKPENILNMAEELKKTLGDDLKAVMQEKSEIISEQKVQKSVSKLGAVLSEVPF